MDQQLASFAILVVIAAALGSIAILIKRGEAKPGVVLIILVLAVFFVFWMEFKEKGLPEGSGSLSGAIVIGVIASRIAGVILLGIKKK
jgi:hypothetical protein